MNTANRVQRMFVMALTFLALFAPTASWSAEGNLRVAIVVVDSLMPHEIGLKMPNVSKLKEMGTFYEESRSVFSAETIPNHVAMITGRYPEFNGIPTNKYWDRIEGSEDVDLAFPSELEAPTLFELIDGFPGLQAEGRPPLPAACAGEKDLVTAAVMSKDYLFNIFSACDEFYDDETCVRWRTQAEYHWAAPFYIPESGHIVDPFTIAAARAYLGDGGISVIPETPANGPFLEALAMLPNPNPEGGGSLVEPTKAVPADLIFINMGDVDRLGHSDPTGVLGDPGNSIPLLDTDGNPITEVLEGVTGAIQIPIPLELPQGRDVALADADRQITDLVRTLGYDLDLNAPVDGGNWSNTVVIIASDHGMDWKGVSASEEGFAQFTGNDLSEEIADKGIREVANAGTTGLYIEDRSTLQSWQNAVDVHKAITANIADPENPNYPAEVAYFVYDPTESPWNTKIDPLPDFDADTIAYIRNNLIPGSKNTDPTDRSKEGPINLGLAKHENLGDIIVSAKEGFAYGSPLPGNHGHRLTLHNTMLISGGAPIIKPGVISAPADAPADEVQNGPGSTSTINHLWRGAKQSENVDIGATVAWLLGVLSPEQIEQQMDGRILYEAFDLSQPLPTPGSCGNVAEWAFVSVDEARELAGEAPRTKPRCKGCKVESNRPEGSKGKPRCKGCKVE